MFKKKLLCLEHPNPEIKIEDEKQFRNLVLWLEDQKIRLYKIEERAGLRQIASSDWPQVFQKYKNDLNCPKELVTDGDILKWILSYAVRLEFLDNANDYKAVTSKLAIDAEKNRSSAPTVNSVNAFDNLDFSTPEFEAGVRSLAEKLSVPHHPDTQQVLVAISRVVKDNLNKEILKQPLLEGNPFPIFDGQGMNQADDDIEQAARILRLLQIQSIREMQTIINETIVETQSLTTDTPITDIRLGKSGRKD